MILTVIRTSTIKYIFVLLQNIKEKPTTQFKNTFLQKNWVFREYTWCSILEWDHRWSIQRIHVGEQIWIIRIQENRNLLFSARMDEGTAHTWRRSDLRSCDGNYEDYYECNYDRFDPWNVFECPSSCRTCVRSGWHYWLSFYWRSYNVIIK